MGKKERIKLTNSVDTLTSNVNELLGRSETIIKDVQNIYSCFNSVNQRLEYLEKVANQVMDSKKMFIPTTLNRPDSEFRIHFIRTIDPANSGDFNCNPYTFFKDFSNYPCMMHDWRSISWNEISGGDFIIIGGGGMFDGSDEMQTVINALVELSDNVISWGVGTNSHLGFTPAVPINKKRFKICTVRDYSEKSTRYIPDVTCMLSELDADYTIKRDIGIIEHHDFPIQGFEYDKISNRYELANIIRFIGESKVIITNTWHSAYWAMLMNKKVILYRPFSNKFYTFKHQPLVYSGDLINDIRSSEVHDDYLEECRRLNIAFFDEIIELIKTNKYC